MEFTIYVVLSLQKSVLKSKNQPHSRLEFTNFKYHVFCAMSQLRSLLDRLTILVNSGLMECSVVLDGHEGSLDD